MSRFVCSKITRFTALLLLLSFSSRMNPFNPFNDDDDDVDVDEHGGQDDIIFLSTLIMAYNVEVYGWKEQEEERRWTGTRNLNRGQKKCAREHCECPWYLG